MKSKVKVNRDKFVCSFSELRNSKFIHGFEIFYTYLNLCFLYSGFVESNMIKNYRDNYTKYSAKRTRGLENAVARCEEFLSDPMVSIEKDSFVYITLIHFTTIVLEIRT